jgi:hypothetical protein
MPWKTTGGANSADGVKTQQGNSGQTELVDVWYSGNVIINGRETALWNSPDQSAIFAANIPAVPAIDEIDQTTYNAAVASNGPPEPGNPGDGTPVPGASEMPGVGSVLNNSTTTNNTVTSDVFVENIEGGGIQLLINNVNTTVREALMPNKPWKAKNKGTDGTGNNGLKLTDVGVPSSSNVLQLYADSGYAIVKNDGVHWCAAYVTALLKRSGLPYVKTLRAFDYLVSAGKWKGAVAADPKDWTTWRYNDVMVIAGHVCFVRGFDPDKNTVLVAGGNQAQDVSEIGWRNALSQIKGVGRAWPDDGKRLPSIGEARVFTKVATHGGTNS